MANVKPGRQRGGRNQDRRKKQERERVLQSAGEEQQPCQFHDVQRQQRGRVDRLQPPHRIGHGLQRQIEHRRQADDADTGDNATSNSSPCATMKIAASWPSTASQRSRRMVSRRMCRCDGRKSEAAVSVMSGQSSGARVLSQTRWPTDSNELQAFGVTSLRVTSLALHRAMAEERPSMTGNSKASSRPTVADSTLSAAIEVDRLVKVYKQTRAVDGISFYASPRQHHRAARRQRRRQDHHHRDDHGSGAADLRPCAGARASDARGERGRAGADELRKPLCRHADAAHGAAEPHHFRQALCGEEPRRPHRKTRRRARSQRFHRPRQRQALRRAEDPRRAGEGADQRARAVAAGRADRLARP